MYKQLTIYTRQTKSGKTLFCVENGTVAEFQTREAAQAYINRYEQQMQRHWGNPMAKFKQSLVAQGYNMYRGTLAGSGSSYFEKDGIRVRVSDHFKPASSSRFAPVHREVYFKHGEELLFDGKPNMEQATQLIYAL